MFKELFAALVLFGFSVGAIAQDCAHAKGTYLTAKVDTSGVDKGVVGRTILSLVPGGFATMTDSAQGGVQGYQAFGMMQGSWHCSKSDDGETMVTVTLLDFSYPNEANPDAKVALVEIAGSVDTATGNLQGKTSVKLYPIGGDPFSSAKPDLDVGYTFQGQRMPSP